MAVVLWLPSPRLAAAEPWESVLSQMPLGTGSVQLTRTNCVDVMLRAFQSNHVVKALIFMPGATDEFYMFRRARATVTNAAPSLLDAVKALNQQTLIRTTFKPPFLLLHSDEDPLDLQINVEYEPTVTYLKQTPFVPYVLYNDRDWDSLLPVLKHTLKLQFYPVRRSHASWHFYRHSFAAWNLTGWEALQAIAHAGKTGFTVRHKAHLLAPSQEIIFQGDRRVLAVPQLTEFPK